MTDAVRLVGSRDLGRLEFDRTPEADALDAAIRAAGDLPPAARPRRVEVDLAADAPRRLRHVLHRHGFRLEGVARQAGVGADGRLVDVLRYARLSDDPDEPRLRFTAVMNTVTARKRLIAHVLISDADGRVLLCETSFKRELELPGGIVEPFESPRLGAVREMQEEMGADLGVGRLLVADWLPPHLGWEDALELIFDAPAMDAATAALLRPDGQEIVSLHWLSADEASERMYPIAAKHLRQAIAARESGDSRYLESGEPLAST